MSCRLTAVNYPESGVYVYHPDHPHAATDLIAWVGEVRKRMDTSPVFRVADGLHELTFQLPRNPSAWPAELRAMDHRLENHRAGRSVVAAA